MRLKGASMFLGLVISGAVPAQEDLEPEVLIRPGVGRTIEEYRQNGQLYMVKITPSKGPPYYFIDTDGDGDLETRRPSVEEPPPAPRWILFRW